MEYKRRVIESFLGGNPMLQDPGPLSLSTEADSQRFLIQVGFSNVNASSVKQTGQIESAASAAKGFTQGLPVYRAINKKHQL